MTRSHLCVIALAATLLGATVAVQAQHAVVSPERGSALKKDFPFVRFSTLASFELPPAEGFVHEAPGARAEGSPAPLAIPPDIVALHGTRASVRGFMLPIDIDAGGVRSFLLTASIDSCHWGAIGLPNEWILVEMTDGARVPFVKFQPVTVFGTLSVEPSYRGARLSGLYQIRAEWLSVDAL